MLRRRAIALSLTLVTLASCTATDATAPIPSATTQYDGAVSADRGYSWGQSPQISCKSAPARSGSATIGPNGGVVNIGPHRLYVPGGALSKPTLISGTVPSGTSMKIDFKPDGLRFKWPAVVVLDMSNCSDLPTLLFLRYLDPAGGGERIPAFYSRWFETLTAPIEHFSGYQIEF
jgi:hypothetical protein